MKIRRIDFYPDDFLVGVSGMTPTEGWVYWIICSLIYSSGGPIRHDDKRILKNTGLRKDHLKRVCDSLVSDAKVLCNDGELMVKRCSIELERAANRVSRARENGAKGNKSKHIQSAGGKIQSTLSNNKQQTTRVSAGIGRGNGLDAQPPNALKQYETGFTDEHNRVHVKLADGPILKIGPYGAVDVAYEPRDYERRLAFTSEQAVQMRTQALENPKTLVSSLETKP
jgi:uncharacterized protein YdaU (DUF1376 family)